MAAAQRRQVYVLRALTRRSRLISRRSARWLLQSPPEMHNPPIPHVPQGQYQPPRLPPNKRYPPQETPRDCAGEVNFEFYTDCGCLIVPPVPTPAVSQYHHPPRFPCVHSRQNDSNLGLNYPTPHTDFDSDDRPLHVERGRGDQSSQQGPVRAGKTPKYRAKLNTPRPRHDHHPYERGSIPLRQPQRPVGPSTFAPAPAPAPPSAPPSPAPAPAPAPPSAPLTVSYKRLVAIAQSAAVLAVKAFIDGDCAGNVFIQPQEDLRALPEDESCPPCRPSLPSIPHQDTFVRPSPPPLAPPNTQGPTTTLPPHTQTHPPDITSSCPTSSYAQPTAAAPPETAETQARPTQRNEPPLRPIPSSPRQELPTTDSLPHDGHSTVAQAAPPNTDIAFTQRTAPQWEPRRVAENSGKHVTKNIGREDIVISPSPSPVPSTGQRHLPQVPPSPSPLPSQTIPCPTTSTNNCPSSSRPVVPKESMKNHDSSTTPVSMPKVTSGAISDTVAQNADIPITTPDRSSNCGNHTGIETTNSGAQGGSDVVRSQASSPAFRRKRNPKPRGNMASMACNFCRGRRIACGLKRDGLRSPCETCQRRNLVCVYPAVSRRGTRPNRNVPVAAECGYSMSEIIYCYPPAVVIEREEE